MSNRNTFNDLQRPLTWFSWSRYSVTLNICELAKDTARVTMQGEVQALSNLSNGTIFNDLKGTTVSNRKQRD